MIIRPPFLTPGDGVAIVAPASMINPAYVKGAAERLASWQLGVVVSPHCLGKSGVYSGTIDERLDDFRKVLYDPGVKAVLCSRGGYGAVHLLDRLADDVARNPKWIIGFSDISALHALCVNRGLMSLHALPPSANTSPPSSANTAPRARKSSPSSAPPSSTSSPLKKLGVSQSRTQTPKRASAGKPASGSTATTTALGPNPPSRQQTTPCSASRSTTRSTTTTASTSTTCTASCARGVRPLATQARERATWWRSLGRPGFAGFAIGRRPCPLRC